MYDKPKHPDIVCFDESAPGKAAYFEHDFNGYSLEARVLYNTARDEPWVFMVHGARSDYTKANAVAFGLQKRGYSTLGHSMSGHGPAGRLKPEQTTLASNITETEAFYGHLNPQRKKIVFGFSLGGTPALELLRKHSDEIESLVLFYPAIYPKNSHDAHFGAEFRAIISEPFSYRNNSTIDLLRAFKGKLLLVVGEYDGLDPTKYGKPAGTSAGVIEIAGKEYYSPIPKEVIDMVYDAIPAGRKQRITIPGCDHSVILWMREYPKEAEKLLDQIHEYLTR